MNKALGMIETKGLIASIEAADAMVKSADVTLVRQEKVDAALVTIVIEGDVSAVQAALEAGKEAASRFGTIVSSLVLPHPDEETRKLISKKEKKDEVASENIEVVNESEVPEVEDDHEDTDDN
ncbi:BMC domain-containing protein [Cytobacillus sp. FJAT-54145]|uniref:BMC domain-containing protein n=1 Tax=Cytobacillus spartinae TaxID=3299023 RepID=A0ABW6KD84_9BACI